ncbi:hypothetical protein CGGC5_v016947 [Colletotrichum fructicola Nara gc5]|uniref:Uncharacterized protein n=1 Tax=Colletotrichum fructicola (strain Nara gc5) TaxID=1213859 RepID=A0A7J6IEQ2_COLFN|nr:hypothetical protein CGGC5_v016947 [Colletotrichum fructicola Nara gc5]
MKSSNASPSSAWASTPEETNPFRHARFSLHIAWILTPLRPQKTKHRQLSARWRSRCMGILFVYKWPRRLSATASLPLAAQLLPEAKMNHQVAYGTVA